ncbi:hypothetical protein KOR42_39630 [Thalassoglobus neptunius]|uniref:Uncharacterized protein n=1 Tax=Thalassoglobus neptunius TaxID=1938619 RepID=A0A5C5WEV4_9PLAN|nr:hypothetical protein [Thalassoglobus neptunius]TWT49047.1 hypothetical protein KOR42_39630 [Thalassoglobus neptunius]
MSKWKRENDEQAKLNYSRRGRELDALRDIRLNDPYSRLILFVLDTMLGTNWKYLDKTIEEVMEVCELKRSVFYDRMKQLREAALISVDDIEGSSRKRWRIIRSNISEAAASSKTRSSADSTPAENAQGNADANARPKSRTTEDSTPSENAVREMDAIQEADEAVQEMDELVQQTDEAVQEMDGSVQQADCTVLHAPHAQHAPSRSPSRSASGGRTIPGREGGGEASVICRLGNLDVRWATEVVERAIQRGCTPDQLHEVIDYFEDQRTIQCWEVGALVKRIESASPGLEPHQGRWPEAKRDSKPREQQSRIAEAMEQLSDDRLRAIVNQHATLRSMLELYGNLERLRADATAQQIVARLVALKPRTASS